MESKPNKVVSAQVLLRSASGKVISTETIITSENIKEYLPSDATIARAKKYFIDAEFEVGEYVGASFAITAPASKFEKIFNSILCIEEDGSIKATNDDGTINYELPLGALPNSVKSLIVAITFTPLPAFGPTNFELP